jgi:hypothetical protein
VSEIFRPTIAMNDPAPKMHFGLIDDPDWQQERDKEGCCGFDLEEAFEKGEG